MSITTTETLFRCLGVERQRGAGRRFVNFILRFAIRQAGGFRLQFTGESNADFAAPLVHLCARSSCRRFPGALPVANAANVWDGGGGNDNWSTPQNWDDDLLPAFPQPITFGGATRLTPNNNLTSITVNGITFDGGAGAFVIGGNSFSLGGDIVDNAATPERINNGLALTGTRTINVLAGGNLTLGGAITGTGNGITKIGDGNLTLAGANSYTGNTTVGSSTSNGGTLFVGPGATLGSGTGTLRLGGFTGNAPAPGTGAPVLTGFAFNGNLDLTGNSATVASLIASGDFSSLGTGADTINIATGKTLTVTGNVLVGGLQKSTITNTALQVTGAGNLKFGSGAGGSFEVWNRSANNGVNTTTSVFDASAAANFTADYGNGGQILIGASAADAPYGTLILGSNNTLISSSLQVGVNGITSGSSANRGGGTLRLGATNLIRADNIIVGSGKASLTTITANGGGFGASGSTAGSLMIFNDQTGVIPQTAVFRAQDGVGRINQFTISDQSLYSSNGSTGGTGFVDFTGGSVDALINSLRIGVGKSGSNNASSTGTLIFSAGTIDANSIILGQRGTSSGTPPATGTIIMGGGTLIAGAGGIRIADTTVGTRGNTSGTLTIMNGLVKTSGNITGATSTVTNATATSTITLNAGTLDMQGHNIATYASPITAINFNGGNVNNAAAIAGKTISIAAGVNFTGAPNFVLADGGSFSAPTPFTLSSSGGLGGGGTVNVGTVNTSIVAASGATVAPGSSTLPGTLQIGGDLSLNSGSAVRFKLNQTPGTGNDLITAANLNLAGTVDLQIGLAGLGPTVGNTYSVITYSGALTGNETNFNVIQPVSRPTFSVVPTATSLGSIQVTVGGNPSLALKWIGNVNSNWDLTTTSNWQNPSLSSDKFFNLDTVTFDDTSTNLNDVQLVGSLFPVGINVNGTRNYKFAGSGSFAGGALTLNTTGTLIVATDNTTTVDTTITAGTLQLGDGGTTGSLGTGNLVNNGKFVINRSDNLSFDALISGTGQVQKLGANTLTLTGSNTYSGTTTISAGTVIVTNATITGAIIGTSLGDGSSATPGDVIVASGAAIDLVGSNTGNGLNFGQKNFKIAGTGVGGTGVLVNSGTTGQQNAFQKVTLTGNATIGGTGRFDVRDPTDDLTNTASLDLAGFTLTKEGTNQVTMVHANVSAGDIVVNNGIFSFEGSVQVPAATKPDNVTPYTITYNTGTTLQVFLQSANNAPPAVPDGLQHFNLSRNVVINGEVTIRNNGSTVPAPIASPITMNGNITFTANAATSGITMTGDINEQGGPRSLTKQSANTVTLTGLANYTGPTTVSAGTLAIGADNRINDASKLVLAGGTFSAGGFNETLNQLAVTNSASHLDLGFTFTNTLTFSPSGNTLWTGLPSFGLTQLTIDDWAQGSNHIFVGTQPYAPGSTTMGLSTTQLSRITFSGHSQGATLIAGGELVPQDSVPTTIASFPLGDFNLNNTFDAADIPAMLAALTDLPKYETTNHIFDSDLIGIGDFNGDGKVTNADIQQLLDAAITAGFGSVAAVPEPASMVLLGLGSLALVAPYRRRRVR